MNLQRLFRPAIALLIATTGAVEVRSALGETQTWDEGIHISAGYAYLTAGDYTWNVEHPPLVKVASALPLTFLGLAPPAYTAPGGARQDQVHLGIDFLYKNRRPADTILIAARSANIVLSLAFIGALAWWMRRRFGALAALCATALCAFDPNLIAHGRYVTTDAPLATFYFFACVLWTEYLERGGLRRLLLAAAAIAIAMLVKFSAVLLFFPLALLLAIAWVQRPREFPLWRAPLAALTIAGVIAVAVVVVYWPETVRCWKAHGEPWVFLGSETDPSFFAVLLHQIQIPSHSFLLGLNKVISHNEGGHASYLLGIRAEKGWWYYFPVVFAVKSTAATLAATLLLLAAGVWLAFTRISRRLLETLRAIPLIAFALTLPPLLFFLSSMTSGINLGLRHILPIYPFLYAAIAAGLAAAPLHRVARYAMAALVLAQAAECASIAPDYLAFFNVLAGGPGRGPEYLVDSNIDWGQDVKKLDKWLAAHGTHHARVYYFGNAQMTYHGIKEMGFPTALDQAGWDEIDDFCVASVTPLMGVYVPLEALAPLRMREPIAKVGWSMYVYDLRKPKPGVHP